MTKRGVKMSATSLVFLLIIATTLALAPGSHAQNQNQNQSQNQNQTSSSSASTTTKITYHGGPLLTESSGINVYIIWYGAFSLEDRTSIIDFFSSLNPKEIGSPKEPSVLTWWKTTQSYKDKIHSTVSGSVRLVKQLGDVYSLGKNIKRAQIGDIVKNQIDSRKVPIQSNGIYLVITSKDVTVEKFCMNSCGFHDSIDVTGTGVVYAHVGDSNQCPGLCAWPYAVPPNGPPGQQALVAPNGVGADGMIINIATVLVGAATNPYDDGYFQGDALAPLEAVTACPGIFGAGAYPGNPGKLMVDSANKASYNAYGANGKKFLLPAIWDLTSSTCKVLGA